MLLVVQVPHHGAKREWDKFDKARYMPKLYVISFGLGNLYGHPHKKTVDCIHDKKIKLVCVTQNEGLLYCIV